MAHNQLAVVGRMLSNDSRAEILSLLMGGKALTGGELSKCVGISPSTTSGHLAKLIDTNLVAVAAQGRHRYFRLASAEVAAMLEAIGATPVAASELPQAKAPAALLYARTCYDHLAGTLAVRIYDSLIDTAALIEHDDHVELTDAGAKSFAALGVDVDAARTAKRPTTRACLDWTERRHHLAGSAASGLLDALIAKKWVARARQPRAIRVSEAGRIGIFEHFGLGDARLSA